MGIDKSHLLALIGAAFLMSCQAEMPQRTSNSQDLMAQVEAIEADEAVLLFQRAKEAAENEEIKEARALIEQALGRGAGSVGMVEAEAEIERAEARIAERRRKAEAERQRKAEMLQRAERQRIERENSTSRDSAEQDSRNDLFCYSIKNENARYACLQKPYQTRNENSRSILLGQCYGVSDDVKRQGFSEVCARGKSGCYALKNSDLHYSCTSCNGSKKWAATAVAGTVMRCF